MPPPAAHQKRMTANPARPERYRPGKATYQDRRFSSDSDSDSDDRPAQKQTQAPPAQPKQAPHRKTAGTILNVDLEARRQQALRDEARRKTEEQLAREKAERDAGFVTESESGSDDEDDSDAPPPKNKTSTRQINSNANASGTEESDSDSDGSEETSSSSEEDSKPRLLRPTFIKKQDRTSSQSQTTAQQTQETQRRTEADTLLQDRLEKEALARAAGRKGWDDDTHTEAYPDDTDNLDPELEKKEWLARELSRIKRSKDSLRAREEELEERERRRDMTEAEREAEDLEKIRSQVDEKKDRGQLGYMQKYYHKGAFHHDNEEVRKLLSRDLRGHKVQDETDKSLLPSALQIRDQTKIGKKGATKYKDLRAEDTGRFGELDGRRRGGGLDMDERFRPDGPGGRDSATGANAGGLGKRKAFGDEREPKRTRVEDVR